MAEIQHQSISLLTRMAFLMTHVCNTLRITQLKFVIHLMCAEIVHLQFQKQEKQDLKDAGLFKTINDFTLLSMVQ